MAGWAEWEGLIFSEGRGGRGLYSESAWWEGLIFREGLVGGALNTDLNLFSRFLSTPPRPRASGAPLSRRFTLVSRSSEGHCHGADPYAQVPVRSFQVQLCFHPNIPTFITNLVPDSQEPERLFLPTSRRL